MITVAGPPKFSALILTLVSSVALINCRAAQLGNEEIDFGLFGAQRLCSPRAIVQWLRPETLFDIPLHGIRDDFVDAAVFRPGSAPDFCHKPVDKQFTTIVPANSITYPQTPLQLTSLVFYSNRETPSALFATNRLAQSNHMGVLYMNSRRRKAVMIAERRFSSSQSGKPLKSNRITSKSASFGQSTPNSPVRTGKSFVSCLLCGLLSLSAAPAFAQGGRGGPPRTARQAAPVDFTGYWVAVVVEDWKYRMLHANKGDYAGLPLNAAARTAAGAWDPAKDPPAAEDCRNFGAVNLMRQPGRLHITWQDDRTLKLESDAGAQTRLLSFTPPPARGPNDSSAGWQGLSLASWDTAPGGRGPVPTGSLKIVTTQLKPGFLRSNGVPYSANTTLTEYFDLVDFGDGNSYLVVSTTVDDPANLNAPYLTSVHFRKQADAAGWNPAPCR